MTMGKMKRLGNRLSVAFSPGDSPNKRSSRIFSAPPPVSAKEPELETSSERSIPVPTKSSERSIPVPEKSNDSVDQKPSRNFTTPTPSPTPAPAPAPASVPATSTVAVKEPVEPQKVEVASKEVAAKPTTSSLIELAAIITRETEKLDKFMKENGGPAPSFDVDGLLEFPKLPSDIKAAREAVVKATKELGDLVTGPRESVRWMAWDHNNSLSLHAIYHYRIAKSFPVGEVATYTQIAEKVGLDEGNVRRFLRHAMTNRIFREVDSNTVAHTAASRVLAEDGAMDDWVGFCVEDIWPAASQTIAALKAHPAASEPTQTGFCVSNNTTNVEPMFATFGKSPLRAKRMGGAMTSLTGGVGYEVSYLLSMYPWSSLPPDATVVDVGGSHGFVCVELAKIFPEMKFIVQDLPKTVLSAPKLDGTLAERVKFQAHDFFDEQPVKGADVYLYRWILHNHSDKYSEKMLRALIPALKKGARVVINDHCLKDSYGEERLWDERIIRTMDLVMLTLLNAKERTGGEFKELFKAADPRFRFEGVKREEGCRMSVVEAVWEGEDFGGEGKVVEALPESSWV